MLGLTKHQRLIAAIGITIALLVGAIEVAGHMQDGLLKIFLLAALPLLLDQFRRWKEAVKIAPEIDTEKARSAEYERRIDTLKKQRDVLGASLKALRAKTEGAASRSAVPSTSSDRGYSE